MGKKLRKGEMLDVCGDSGDGLENEVICWYGQCSSVREILIERNRSGRL